MTFECQCRAASGLGQWCTVLYRKEKCLLLLVGHKTGVIKPGISTKGSVVIKYYKMPLFVLTVYGSFQVEAAVPCPWISVFQMQLLDSCVLLRGACRRHSAASLPVVPRWIALLRLSMQKAPKEISSSRSAFICLNQFVLHDDKKAMDSLTK